MILWLKKLSGTVGDGVWLSGRPHLAPLDLPAHWDQMAPLIAAEGLPHTRDDVQRWMASDGAVGLVATKNGAFAGFFIGHPTGTVAHLDLICIHPEFKRASIARPLYYRVVNTLKANGCTGFVAHTRGHAGRLLELVGFSHGSSYRHVYKTLGAVTVSGGHRGELLTDNEVETDAIVALDRQSFGAERPQWVKSLLNREDHKVYGLQKDGQLAAALVLTPRSGGVMHLSLALGASSTDITSLLHVVTAINAGRTFEADVRAGSGIEQMFTGLGFESDDDVAAIVEYRMGETAGVGDGSEVHLLSWW
jgi:ribosomal protein S18 acetylase RimI-like enzyme